MSVSAPIPTNPRGLQQLFTSMTPSKSLSRFFIGQLPQSQTSVLVAVQSRNYQKPTNKRQRRSACQINNNNNNNIVHKSKISNEHIYSVLKRSFASSSSFPSLSSQSPSLKEIPVLPVPPTTHFQQETRLRHTNNDAPPLSSTFTSISSEQITLKATSTYHDKLSKRILSPDLIPIETVKKYYSSPKTTPLAVMLSCFVRLRTERQLSSIPIRYHNELLGMIWRKDRYTSASTMLEDLDDEPAARLIVKRLMMENVLESLINQQMTLNSFTFEQMMKAYLFMGDVKAAETLFTVMKSHGINLHDVGYFMFEEHFAKKGDWKNFVKYFEELPRHGNNEISTRVAKRSLRSWNELFFSFLVLGKNPRAVLELWSRFTNEYPLSEPVESSHMGSVKRIVELVVSAGLKVGETSVVIEVLQHRRDLLFGFDSRKHKDHSSILRQDYLDLLGRANTTGMTNDLERIRELLLISPSDVPSRQVVHEKPPAPPTKISATLLSADTLKSLRKDLSTGSFDKIETVWKTQIDSQQQLPEPLIDIYLTSLILQSSKDTTTFDNTVRKHLKGYDKPDLETLNIALPTMCRHLSTNTTKDSITTHFETILSWLQHLESTYKPALHITPRHWTILLSYLCQHDQLDLASKLVQVVSVDSRSSVLADFGFWEQWWKYLAVKGLSSNIRSSVLDRMETIPKSNANRQELIVRGAGRLLESLEMRLKEFKLNHQVASDIKTYCDEMSAFLHKDLTPTIRWVESIIEQESLSNGDCKNMVQSFIWASLTRIYAQLADFSRSSKLPTDNDHTLRFELTKLAVYEGTRLLELGASQKFEWNIRLVNNLMLCFVRPTSIHGSELETRLNAGFNRLLHLLDSNKSLSPDAYTYNRIIEGLCQQGKFDVVREVVSDRKWSIPSMGLLSTYRGSPDGHTASIVMSSLLRKAESAHDGGKRTELAQSVVDWYEWFSDTFKESSIMTTWHKNLLLQAYRHLGLENQVSALWQSMRKADVDDSVTRTILLDHFGFSNDLNALESVWNSIRDLPGRHMLSNRDDKKPLKKDEERNALSKSNEYNSYLEALCRLQAFDKVLSTLKEMMERGVWITGKTKRNVMGFVDNCGDESKSKYESALKGIENVLEEGHVKWTKTKSIEF